MRTDPPTEQHHRRGGDAMIRNIHALRPLAAYLVASFHLDALIVLAGGRTSVVTPHAGSVGYRSGNI